MDWIEILSLLFLVMMAVVIFPRAKHLISNSRKAESGEWMGALLPILAVVAFVVFLMMAV